MDASAISYHAVSVGDLLERLIAISAREMVAASGLSRTPVAPVAEAVFRWASTPLARALARFDQDLATSSLPAASRKLLAHLRASVRVVGAVPARGAVVVIANHPGAYDALALFQAIARRDLLVLAADREFLRALPALQPHLVYVDDPQSAAAGVPSVRNQAALRRARAHLAEGGALLHFGAGVIEPDPAFCEPGVVPLQPWLPGTGFLASQAAPVYLAAVDGVHSSRAKALPPVRWLEARGLDTLTPLLQVAVPGFQDVRARVRLSPFLRRPAEGRGRHADVARAARSALLDVLAR